MTRVEESSGREVPVLAFLFEESSTEAGSDESGNREHKFYDQS